MKFFRPLFNMIILGSMSWIFMFPASAQDDPESEAERCVRLNRINTIEILDQRNIVFRMRGNDYYLNILPYECNGLSRNDTIMFRTSINEVCDVDVITILNDIGPGFQAGISCGLGRFNPINEDEIARLRDLLK